MHGCHNKLRARLVLSHFILLCSQTLRFYKLKARPSTSKKIMTYWRLRWPACFSNKTFFKLRYVHFFLFRHKATALNKLLYSLTQLSHGLRNQNNCVTHFPEILALWQWSGAECAMTMAYACTTDWEAETQEIDLSHSCGGWRTECKVPTGGFLRGCEGEYSRPLP